MEQNLSQYKIFYEVAKAGNISKAAKELYISQPAISKAISKLEDSLGLSLFTRSSRGVQLTSEGEILFEHTREAFDALDRGEQELKRIQEFDIGHLRIGVSNTLCKYILLPYLKTFIDQYPHMKVTIESQATAQTLAAALPAMTGIFGNALAGWIMDTVGLRSYYFLSAVILLLSSLLLILSFPIGTRLMKLKMPDTRLRG